MKFAFITQHYGFSQEKRDFALTQGHTLTYVKVPNVRKVTPALIRAAGSFEGVVIDYDAVVEMRLSPLFIIGVFESRNFAPKGSIPQKEIVAFKLYDGRF